MVEDNMLEGQPQGISITRKHLEEATQRVHEEAGRFTGLRLELREDMSEAIANVLKKYEISGPYIFSVWRDEELRGHEPIKSLKGVRLTGSGLLSMGKGYADTENPRDVRWLHPLERK